MSASGSQEMVTMEEQSEERVIVVDAPVHEPSIDKVKDISGVALKFDGLVYSAPLKDGTFKTILKGVSGEAFPGEILAVMGPSGSGKSSLLSVLSGSIPAEYQLKGNVRANGKRLGSEFTKKVAGFVYQDDLLFSNLTVKETLDFSAELRLPRSMSAEQRNQKVFEVIGELGLRKVQDTFIGNEMVRGVSGGERKRVSIASELIREVSVLLLDEPTSGLDSFMAFNVIETLKELARSKGITIITTIHQPRSQIWGLFDRLLLLSEGEVMYSGKVSEVVPYFTGIGYECPKLFNPADYLLDIVALDYRSVEKEKETRERVEFFASSFEKTVDKIDIVDDDDETGVIEDINFSPTASFLKQYYILLKRASLQIRRDKFATIIKLCQTIFFGLLIGGIFFDLGDGQQSVQDRVGLLFFVTINQSFGALLDTVTRFVGERGIFRRENRLGFYKSSTYYLGKTTAELPVTLFFPFLFAIIIYWMAGLQDDVDRFFIFVGTLILVAFTAEGLGLTIGTFVPNAAVGGVLGISSGIIAMIFAGLFVNSAGIHPFFYFIERIDFLKFAYRALMENEFDGLVFTCTEEEQLKDGLGTDVCPFQTGDDVLRAYSMNSASLGLDILYLFLVGVVFRVLAYVILTLTKSRLKQV